MDMRLEVTYTHYDISSKKKTGSINIFAQFEEGNLLSETCDYAQSSDKYDDN